MQIESIQPWIHEHVFGQDVRRSGERRTLIVIALTAAMMVVEIAAGAVFGSMALLADGLHMASHSVAIGITAVAYAYARRHASDSKFSFGTGKVGSLAGFCGAVLLGVFALVMATESVERIVRPVTIAFDEAIAVAVVGLAVNGLCGALLHAGHDRHDHSLRSAYLHVLADALTSFLAIIALTSAKLFGLLWMDPIMGIVEQCSSLAGRGASCGKPRLSSWTTKHPSQLGSASAGQSSQMGTIGWQTCMSGRSVRESTR